MTRRAKNNDAFSIALLEHLARHSTSQNAVASAAGVSRAYINRLTKGEAPSAEWCELIADVTLATDEERRALHRAAATTKGYKI